MATTSYGVNHPLAVKLWARKLWVEVLQEAIATKFMGKSPSSLIQIKEETSKAPGDRVTVGIRYQLSAAGVQGDNTLQDNEEALSTSSFNLLIDQLRNAVRSGGKMSEQRVPFDVREEAKSALVDWWADRIDTCIINQLTGNTAQTDTRFTGNQATIGPDTTSHLLLGGAVANEQSLTGTSQNFDLTLIDKAIERARTITPGLRPVKQMGGEYYVTFIHPTCVTSLRSQTSTGQYLNIQQSALQGGVIERNPIFTGALGMFNNTVIHVDKRLPLAISGSTGTTTVANTRRNVFCGAQAAAIAFGRDYGAVDRFKWVEQLFDYENQLGVSAGLVFGVIKSTFTSPSASSATDYGTIVVATFAQAA